MKEEQQCFGRFNDNLRWSNFPLAASMSCCCCCCCCRCCCCRCCCCRWCLVRYGRWSSPHHGAVNTCIVFSYIRLRNNDTVAAAYRLNGEAIYELWDHKMNFQHFSVYQLLNHQIFVLWHRQCCLSVIINPSRKNDDSKACLKLLLNAPIYWAKNNNGTGVGSNKCPLVLLE